jgi:hypothetical protein
LLRYARLQLQDASGVLRHFLAVRLLFFPAAQAKSSRVQTIVLELRSQPWDKALMRICNRF